MMNSTNRLSVIIPLYNAGNDFKACMESLIAQTWTALEIIIVNDGATDNSVDIAKYYAENYPQIAIEKGTIDEVITMMIRGAA